ncbi:nucleotidyltransferase [Bacillus salitolerans]|uniref:tRNA(Met) cytidine acetate ligase n=1 Tax=Bacillus salitolerans TaxID=1437434 RepID=A0ABW4LKG9_9BACI
MKASGVIVEYNPFHNGHLYHLEQTKKVCQHDILIAVMSGYFLQRGEPALVSKWNRTKMALLNGVDLVVELPYAFSTQKAEYFANGAISILEALKVHNVCFGSESGNIEGFIETADILEKNKDELNGLLQHYVRQGNSFPKSSSLAFESLHSKTKVDLSRPNNILGYHYVKAILDQQASIKPVTIKRTMANYHDEEFNSSPIASATSIRKAIFSDNGHFEDVQHFVPDHSYSQLVCYNKQYHSLHSWENYFPLLKYKLLTSTPDELRSIYEVEEGLEHRLLAYIKDASSFHHFMTKIKTKRYTWTRLQRVCVHILTNTSKQKMLKLTHNKKATYIRLLGMTENGRSYLQKYKKDFSLPIISKLSNSLDEMLQLDIRAANTYAMGFAEPIRTDFLKLEYSTPPIQLK